MERIKHTVNNPYHLWAHQAQDWAKNSSGNRSFEGRRAFSYAACIGQVFEIKGERVYLLSSNTWSFTTSGHQSECRSAVPRGALAFYVPRVGRGKGYYTEGLDMEAHAENVKYLVDQYREFADKASRARGRRVWYLEQALAYLGKARTYAKTFGVKGAKYPTAKQLAALESHRVEWTEKDRTWQEGEDARQAARRAANERQWAERQAKYEADCKLRAMKDAEQLGAWLQGMGSSRALYHLDYPRMRLVGKMVETTQGAEVPAEHVRKAMPLALSYLNAGREFRPNGQTIRLGHFAVSSITADGLVTVGCHRFPKEEVYRFAVVLGLTVNNGGYAI
jgi:hypothetical protein